MKFRHLVPWATPIFTAVALTAVWAAPMSSSPEASVAAATTGPDLTTQSQQNIATAQILYRLGIVQAQLAAAQTETDNLKKQLANKNVEVESLRKQLTEMRAAHTSTPAKPPPPSGTPGKVQSR